MFSPGVVRVPAVPLTRSTRWNQPKTCRSQACDASGVVAGLVPATPIVPGLCVKIGSPGQARRRPGCNQLQLPNLSGPQCAETQRRNFGGLQGLREREERCIERLGGPLEGAVLGAQA